MNNEVHDSVGGQDTAAKNLDLAKIVSAFGVRSLFQAETKKQLVRSIQNLIESVGPSFLEVKIRPGSREDLGRPKVSPIDNKKNFMKFLDS